MKNLSLIFLLFVLSYPSFKKAQSIEAYNANNCISPEYLYDESKTFFGPSKCYSDCECDGQRWCNDDLQCEGVARPPRNSTPSPRPNIQPKPEITKPESGSETNPAPNDPKDKPNPNPEAGKNQTEPGKNQTEPNLPIDPKSSSPETKPEPNPEPSENKTKPNPSIDPKSNPPETKPEPKPEPSQNKTEPNPSIDPKSNPPETKPEPKPEPSENKTEPNPSIDPKSNPPETKPEPKPESRPDSKPDPKPEPNKNKTEPNPPTDPKPVPDKNKTESNPVPDKNKTESNPPNPVPDKNKTGSNSTQPVPDKNKTGSNSTQPVPDKNKTESNSTKPVPDKNKTESNPPNPVPDKNKTGSNSTQPDKNKTGSNSTQPVPDKNKTESNSTKPVPDKNKTESQTQPQPKPKPGSGNNTEPDTGKIPDRPKSEPIPPKSDPIPRPKPNPIPIDFIPVGREIYIYVKHSQKVLNINQASKNNGAQLIQFPLHMGDNQRFIIEKYAGFYVIKAVHSGMLLEVFVGMNEVGRGSVYPVGGRGKKDDDDDDDDENERDDEEDDDEDDDENEGKSRGGWFFPAGGSQNSFPPTPNIIQSPAHYRDNQLFSIEHVSNGWFVIRAKHSKMVFNVVGSSQADAANLIQFAANYGDNQLFRFEETIQTGLNYFLFNNAAKQVLSVKDKERGVILMEKAKNNSQRFELEFRGNNAFAIRSVLTGKYLSIDLNSKLPNAKIVHETSTVSDSNLFIFQHYLEDLYMIRSKISNLYVSAYFWPLTRKNEIIQSPYALNQNQLWKLDPAFPIGTEVMIQTRIDEKFVEVSQDKISEGNPVIIATGRRLNRQIWKIDQNIDGTFSFISHLSGKCLTFNGALEGTRAEEFTCAKSFNQKFELVHIEDDYYTIQAQHSNLFVTLKGGSSVDGNNLVQSKRSLTSNAQLFKFSGFLPLGKDVFIFNKVDNLALRLLSTTTNELGFSKFIGAHFQRFKIDDVHQELFIIKSIYSEKLIEIKSNNDGDQVLQVTPDYGDDQIFTFEHVSKGWHKIVNKLTLKCLAKEDIITGTIVKTTRQNLLVQRTCNLNENQLFKIEFAFPYEQDVYIMDRNSGKYLEVIKQSKNNNAEIIINEKANRDSQKWLIFKENDKFYFKSKLSGKVISVINSSKEFRAKIVQADYVKGNNQLCSFDHTSDGFFVIKFTHTGQVLDVNGAVTTNGNLLVQSPENRRPNQQFKFEIA